MGETAKYAQRELWMHDKKMVIVLNDDDIEQMLLEKKNNNGVLIGLLLGIIVMLLAVIMLFATNTISFNNKETRETKKSLSEVKNKNKL